MGRPVAIFSALADEISLLIDHLEGKRQQQVGAADTWTGVLDGRSVVLARAGIGKVATAMLAGLVWERHRPSSFLFTGVAGAIDPDLGIGDVVIGERSIQHDAGILSPEGLEVYQSGHVPFFNPTDKLGYSPSPGLFERVTAHIPTLSLRPVLGREPRVVTGTIVTGDQFVVDPVMRDRLHESLGGAAVEMEGAALAQVATSLGADHLLVRSLSDRPGEGSIEEFSRFMTEVSANSALVAMSLLPLL